jgi:hypothetical protein
LDTVARAVAISFLVLSAVSGFLYLQTSTNYIWATEAAILLEENIEIAEVRIFPARTPSSSAFAEVVFNVTNRGNVAISIITLEFDLYMDDPLDPRELRDRLGEKRVGLGSFSMDRLTAPSVPPHGTEQLRVRVVVTPGTSEYSTFNTTLNGRYFPVIPVTRIVMSYPDFDVDPRIFYLPNDRSYYPVGGVLPSG